MRHGAKLTEHDELQINRFTRFLQEVGSGPVPQEWMPYVLALGPPPEKGDYPGFYSLGMGV